MTPLEQKAKRLEQKLKSRTNRDGSAKRHYEQNVAQLRAELEIISGRIRYAEEQRDNDGE